MSTIASPRLRALAFLAACAAAPSSWSAELAPGTVIEKSNLDKVKADTFEGKSIASMLTDKVEWQIRQWGLKITLGNAKPVQLDKRYLDATKKYAASVKFDPATREVSGWTAGVPFPNVAESDPNAGDKLLWNHYYASPEGDTADNRATYLLISADKGLESAQDWTFRRYYFKGRLGGSKPVVDDGTVLTKTLFVATAPHDIKGLGTLTVRYDDPRVEDSWAYIKSARRVRRLSGGAWMDPIGGLDQLNDDIYIWNARPTWYPKIKLLGRRWILAITDAKKGYHPEKKGTPEEWSTVDLKEWPHWNPAEVWQPREVYVIEGTTPPGHPYSKKVVYMDVNYPRLYYAEAYDRKGEFWKFINFHTAPAVSEDGIRYLSSTQGETIDFKARHASIFAFRSSKLNGADVTPDGFSIGTLEAMGR
jgi:hypothetical protein